MNAEKLEKLPVPEILLKIAIEWGKIGGKVTVWKFCEVSSELGIGTVEHVLRDTEREQNCETIISSQNGVVLECDDYDSNEALV